MTKAMNPKGPPYAAEKPGGNVLPHERRKSQLPIVVEIGKVSPGRLRGKFFW